jgi:hypothetical protein
MKKIRFIYLYTEAHSLCFIPAAQYAMAAAGTPLSFFAYPEPGVFSPSVYIL